MRFLKKKIAYAEALASLNTKSACHNNQPVLIQSQGKENSSHIQKRNRTPGLSLSSIESLSTKNIAKNYGKAICNFATSPLSLPYLVPILEKETVNLEDFISFAREAKSKVNGLNHFRSILLPNTTDTPQTVSFRNIFKYIGEVFIKYFSVNWIYNSKIVYKEAHLRFRFKMLRRIKCPELFTYLNNSKYKKIKEIKIEDVNCS